MVRNCYWRLENTEPPYNITKQLTNREVSNKLLDFGKTTSRQNVESVSWPLLAKMIRQCKNNVSESRGGQTSPIQCQRVTIFGFATMQFLCRWFNSAVLAQRRPEPPCK